MCDVMKFPNTWEEFEKCYGFTDTEEVYTNGARLIPSFRVEQWLYHVGGVDVVTVRRGKWIVEFTGSNWNDYWDYTCPVCKKKYERADRVLSGAKYCPNCGARMEGEKRE